MKPVHPLLILLILLGISCSDEKKVMVFTSTEMFLGVGEDGHLRSITDIPTGTNYLAPGIKAPLLSIKIDSTLYAPTGATWDNNLLTLYFPGEIEARLKVEEKAGHITFELTELGPMQDIALVLWGPYPTTIQETIGETVGVVRGETFALGIQSLNPKTLGGYPWADNDRMPQFNIFDQEDYSDLSEENKGYTLYRVEAAKPEPFGSVLQAYCRNRFEDRIVSNMKHKNYVSPKYEDNGVIGSKIALFGCPSEKALETIGKIEIAEDLPHPII
ncbi:MAG: hypothetical protein AAFX53_18795, partial [Bacteroidota bacterium]